MRDALRLDTLYPGLILKFSAATRWRRGLSLGVRRVLKSFQIALEVAATEWLDPAPLQGEVVSDTGGGGDEGMEAGRCAVVSPRQMFPEPLFDGRFRLPGSGWWASVT